MNNSLQVFAGGWQQLQHAAHKSTTPSGITNVRGLDFSPDGKKLFTINANTTVITEYASTTDWDILTFSTNGNVFDVLFLGGDARCVQWSLDGMHCYYTTSNPNVIYQLDATIPRDTSTLSDNGVSFSPTEESENIRGIFILPDEKKFYVLFTSTVGPPANIHEYDMPSKGDLANTIPSSNFIPLEPILGPNLIVMFADTEGRFLYIYERGASTIHRFRFNVIKDISSVVIANDELDVSDKEGLVVGMFIRPTDGKKLYITGLISDNFDEYDMSLATNNSIISNLGDEIVDNSGDNLVH